jgi:hypothetical protein
MAALAVGLAWLGYDEPSFGFAGIGIIAFGVLVATGVSPRWLHQPNVRREGLGIVLVGAVLLAGGLLGAFTG